MEIRNLMEIQIKTDFRDASFQTFEKKRIFTQEIEPLLICRIAKKYFQRFIILSNYEKYKHAFKLYTYPLSCYDRVVLFWIVNLELLPPVVKKLFNRILPFRTGIFDSFNKSVPEMLSPTSVEDFKAAKIVGGCV